VSVTGRLVPLNTYRNATEAKLAKSALQAAGIRAEIDAANTLAVDESDADAAEQIVNAMMGIAHAERVEQAEEADRCESCNSPDVERRKKLPAFGLFVALTFGLGAAIDNTLAAFYVCLAGIVFFLAAGNWRCRQCGHTW
jgi:ribosomal protein L37AE/L43A